MICGWKWVDGAPTDFDLIDMLEEYCCQAASLDEYSDRDFYRTLETDRELDDFYALVAMEYRADFSADVRRMGESQHLFFYSNEEMKYINTPVKEIW